jgi:hypothetical protein
LFAPCEFTCKFFHWKTTIIPEPFNHKRGAWQHAQCGKKRVSHFVFHSSLEQWSHMHTLFAFPPSYSVLYGCLRFMFFS